MGTKKVNEDVYDAAKDHERLEKGIADRPKASSVNLEEETIKEASKVEFREDDTFWRLGPKPISYHHTTESKPNLE